MQSNTHRTNQILIEPIKYSSNIEPIKSITKTFLENLIDLMIIQLIRSIKNQLNDYIQFYSIKFD